MVPGADGVRSQGAWRALDAWRSALFNHASTLNLKVKYRESFRPFAPSVLREDVSDWFEMDADSPYMLLVADVVERRRKAMTEAEQKLFGIAKLNIPRSDIPAVTHVDYSARIQTVHAETNPRYHELISAFKRRSGCPVLVNTSFNVRGEPISGHARGCLPLFHGHWNRNPGRGQLLCKEGRPGFFLGPGLQEQV